MKICVKCKKQLDYSEFYRHSLSPDGFHYSCKQCFKKYMQKNLQENIEERLEYSNQYRLKNPLKHKAHMAITWALKQGKIIRQYKCERCGSNENIVCHHEDYNKPLEIIELCQLCHRQIHENYKKQGINLIDRFVPVMQV